MSIRFLRFIASAKLFRRIVQIFCAIINKMPDGKAKESRPSSAALSEAGAKRSERQGGRIKMLLLHISFCGILPPTAAAAG